MPYDPSRLLRQKWSNPDDLARELYVMFTSESPRPETAPVSPEIPSREILRQIPGFNVSTYDRSLSTSAKVNQRLQQSLIVPVSPSVQPNQSPQSHRVSGTTLQRPGDGSEASTPPSVPSSPPAASSVPARRDQFVYRGRKPKGVVDSGGGMAASFPVGQAAVQPQNYSSGQPAPHAQPIPVVDHTQTPTSTEPIRRSQPLNAPSRSQTLAAPSPITVADLPPRFPVQQPRAPRQRDRSDPGGEGGNFEPKPVDLGGGTSTPTEKRTGGDDSPKWGHSEIQTDSNNKLWAVVSQAGIPACKKSSSGSSNTFKPGKGSCIIIDFDGANQMSPYDANECDLYNGHMLPVGGGALIRVEIQGHTLWVSDAPKYCGGKVSTTISSGSQANPGMGRVQLWYTQSGARAGSSSSVTVQSTWGTKGMPGTSCGISVEGGALTLTILDCPKS